MANRWEIPTKRLWGRLNTQLTDLRKRGLVNPRVDDLPDLTGLAAELVPDEAIKRSPAEGGRYWEENTDEQVRRIEVLLECAIDAAFKDASSVHYKPSEVEIARLWFGLDPRTRDADQGERHEQAAACAQIKKTTMEVHRSKSIKAALIQALTARYEGKQAFTVGEATDARPLSDGSPEGSVDQSTRVRPSFQRRGLPTRWLSIIGAGIVGVGALVAMLGVLGVLDSPGGASRKSPVLPPRGSAVNATTGEVEPRPSEESPASIWPLRKTNRLIRVCDLTAGMVCAEPARYIGADSLEVEAGDTIRLQVILDAKPYDPIPFFRLAVNANHEEPAHILPDSPNELQITREILWLPGVSRDGLPRVYTLGPEAVRLTITGSTRRRARLRYVPGSTVLLNSEHNKIGRLPDGVMDPSGVKLTELGAPMSCKFNCELRYLRLVQFEAVATTVN